MINLNNNIAKFNNFTVKFDSEIVCYAEMQDRVIFLVDWFTLQHYAREGSISNIIEGDEQDQNIFCYSTQTGKLLWQIDHKNPQGKIIEDVFVGMDVIINDGKENEECRDIGNLEEKEVIIPHFNLKDDFMRVGTMKGHHFQLDPLTGKITYLYYGK
jgi:hypothetical protein